jgi:hypothetical protein
MGGKRILGPRPLCAPRTAVGAPTRAASRLDRRRLATLCRMQCEELLAIGAASRLMLPVIRHARLFDSRGIAQGVDDSREVRCTVSASPRQGEHLARSCSHRYWDVFGISRRDDDRQVLVSEVDGEPWLDVPPHGGALGRP